MSENQIPEIRGSRFAGVASQFSESEPEFLRQTALANGPITLFRMFGLSFYHVADPELIREILVTRQKEFPKAKRDVEILGSFIGNGLVTSGGEFHAKQRKLAQPAFHARRIGGYASTMVDYTSAVMADWHDGQPLDISQAMYELTMYIVAKTLFDADMSQMQAEAEGVGQAIHLLQAISNADFKSPIQWPHWLPTKRNRLRRQARNTLNSTVGTIINNRRAQAVDGQVADTGDLLSMLMLSQYDDGSFMGDQQLLDEVLTLFVAGHETTSNALSWTWYLLSQHPDVVDKLQAELDGVLGSRQATLADLPQLTYTGQIIKEVLRLYPPAWILNTRTTPVATNLGPYQLPADANIFISPYAMHHLPQYFPEPDAFRPERWTAEFEQSLPRYAYLPFGGGPRVCIGNSFAQMEAQLVLATIGQRFTTSLATEEVKLNPQVTLSPKDGLPVILHARQPVPAPTEAVPALQPA
ncbi:MAG: cytochrome P450 [Anaerolineales bacterium]|nr:cytochrome P450 [Anaerolineales bacterium]